MPETFRFPLSFAQQRLWFLDRLVPGSPVYNVAYSYRMPSVLNVSVLERCLSEIVRRHEALRTTFTVVDGQPVQEVGPPEPVRLPVIDLLTVKPEDREARVNQLSDQHAREPFDLARGPLLRCAVVRLAPSEHVILLTMHHIVSDGWSIGVLARELGTLYSAFVVGRPSPLPELQVQYADYAVWQRERLRGERLERHVDYWRQKLDGLPTLQLPTDRPRPPLQGYSGSSIPVELPPALTESMRRLGQDAGCTLFMVLLAGYQGLLNRYSGQRDLAVGVPVAGRDRTELEGLIGFFVNTLVMRADLSGNPSFRELMKRVRKTATEAYAHQELPFEKLVEELQPKRDLSRQSLIQTTLQLYTYSSDDLRSIAAHGAGVPGRRMASTFDLSLELWEGPDGGVRGYAEYSTDLFTAETVTRMVRNWGRLLESVSARPDVPVRRLSLLGDDERRRLLVDWNRSDSAYPNAELVHELFQRQADSTPDAIAVSCGPLQMTYRELSQRADRLAHRLRRRGVTLGQVVGVCLERSLELMIGLLGVLKAGAAYLPLDPKYPTRRLAFMIDDAEARLAVTQTELARKLPDGHPLLYLDPGSDEGSKVGGGGRGSTTAEKRSNSQQLAYLIYTSGSTGKAKGVAVSHRALVNYLTWAEKAYRVEDGFGAPVHSSISFDFTVTSLFTPLLAGRTVHLVPESSGVDGLAALLEAGSTGGFSFLKLTPAHLELLARRLSAPDVAGSTSVLVIGGEQLLAEQTAVWREAAPDTIVVNEYGPTEAVVGCCAQRAPLDRLRSGPVPIGRPIANTRLYVLDPDQEPTPIGVAGELFVGGDCLASGYLNRPALTARQFVPDPFGDSPGQRLYRTGDLVRYLADGTLQFLGRSDRQIKIRGFRIEPGEIEGLLKRHPAIGDAAIVVRELAPGDQRLVAYVVPEAGARGHPAPTDDDVWSVTGLRAFLRGQLPEFMLPAVAIQIASLPLTSNGKIDRNALPEVPAMRPARPAHVEASSPLETVLTQLLGEVLGAERVGLNDNFFNDLGGHSLLATQLLARIRDILRWELSLRDVFENPSVNELIALAMRDPSQGAKIGRTAELVLALQKMPEESLDDAEGSVDLTARTPIA